MSTKMVTALGKGKDSKEVGTRLAREVKTGLGSEKIGLAILLTSSKYELAPLLKAVRSELGAGLLIGCTTAGEFNQNSVEKESVVLAVISDSDNYRFFVSSAIGLHDDPTGCVQKAVSAIPAQTPGFTYRSAILLHDGLAGRGEEAVLSAATILGPKVSFAGGSAGDDLLFKQTFVFCNDAITTDSVVLCVIDSKLPIGLGVKHGHKPVTEQLTVTKAKDNVLFEVNGEPAWNVWKRLLATTAKTIGIDVNHLDDASAVGQFLIRYELGLSTGKDYKVRVPLSKNDDGSLNFACTIPEGP
jgi:methyl-accepting chemotaxis protein